MLLLLDHRGHVLLVLHFHYRLGLCCRLAIDAERTLLRVADIVLKFRAAVHYIATNVL